MQERHWVRQVQPGPMLEYVRNHSPRKMRCYAAACYRQVQAYSEADLVETRTDTDEGPTDAFSLARRAAEHTTLRGAARQAGERVRVSLIRCIFGNPFRPIVLDAAWLTPDVLRMAETARDNRILPSCELDPVALVVLADALEEAGCTDERIRRHLLGYETCQRCEGCGLSPYDLGYSPPPLETCPDCGGCGWYKSDPPHVRGCHVLDALTDRS